MGHRTLVVYATWTGVTHSIADAVGQTLHNLGTETDVQRAGKIKDISPYSAVVIGTPVHGGKLPGEIPAFVKRFRGALTQRPVAFFVDCLTMVNDTPETRTTTLAYLDPLRAIAPDVQPVDIGLFAGAVLTEGEDFERMFPFFKFITRKMAKEMPPDSRNWDAIRAWATEIHEKFIAAGR
jgi:menaquinone-dependent protoporphyrinogen oxidase